MSLERLAILVTADGGAAIREFGKVGNAADKELGKTEDRTKKMAAGFTAAGTKMVLGAAVIGAALYRAGESASELEQAVGGTEAVFKKNAATVGEWAKTADQALGLSEEAARRLRTQMGGSLKGLGLSLDEATEKSGELIATGADLAATYGGTTADAVQALGSAFRGEFDPLERYNIQLKQSAIDAKAVEMGLATSTSAVDQNARAQATLALITEGSTDAQGAFAREAGTTAGQMARSKAEMDNATAAIGKGFTPVMAAAAGAVGTGAAKFSELDEASGGVIGKVAGVATVAVGAGGALSTLVGGTIKASTNIKALSSNIASVGPRAGIAAGAMLGLALMMERSEEAAKGAGDAIKSAMDPAVARAMAGSYDDARAMFERINVEAAKLVADNEKLGELEFTKRQENTEAINALSEGNNALAGLINRTQQLYVEQHLTKEAAWEMAIAEAKAGEALDNHGDSAADATKIQQDLNKALDDSKKKFDDYWDALNGRVDVQQEYLDSTRELRDTLKDNGTAWNWVTDQLDLSTEAGSENMDAMQSTADRIRDLSRATIDQTGSTDAGRRKFDELTGSLRNTLLAFGYTKDQVDDLMFSLGLTARHWEVALSTSGLDEATAKVGTLNDALRDYQALIVGAGGDKANPNAYVGYGYKPVSYAAPRAAGGPVSAGQAYIVGERQPELFVPRTSGTILPSVPAAAPNITYNVTVQAPAGGDIEALAEAVGGVLRRLAMESS